jgi:hypothetical protein
MAVLNIFESTETWYISTYQNIPNQKSQHESQLLDEALEMNSTSTSIRSSPDGL